MAIFDYSDMTQDEAEILATRLSYIALMGSKTKVAPEMLRYSPTPHLPVPTAEDYKRGEILRFFARKANDPAAPCVEVSVDAYKGPVKNSPFYTRAIVKWKISGSLEDEYSDDGILQDTGVIDHNKNSISSAFASTGIKVNLNNPLEFYKPS